jgi:rhamnose utilization protein RhaD (predicted bifunctional aldolase and dehydrogenase)
LTRAVAATVRPGCSVLLLANHGVVVGADDCESAEALIRDIERRLAEPLRAAPAFGREALERLAQGAGMRLPRDPRVHALACDDISRRRAVAGPLFPDQVVFLGPLVHSYPAPRDAVFALVEGRGVLVSDGATAGQEEMLRALALLLQATPARADVVALDPAEVVELAGWEAERYRIALDARQGR